MQKKTPYKDKYNQTIKEGDTVEVRGEHKYRGNIRFDHTVNGDEWRIVTDQGVFSQRNSLRDATLTQSVEVI